MSWVRTSLIDRTLRPGEVRTKGPELGLPVLSSTSPYSAGGKPLLLLAWLSFPKWERFSDSGDSQPLPESGTGLIQMTSKEVRAGRRFLRCFVFWMDLWVASHKASLGSNWDR